MLASLLWTTPGDSGTFDGQATAQLEHVRSGLIQQANILDHPDPDKSYEYHREVIAGVVLFRSRLAELSGKEKELTCEDYERWEKGAEKIWERYNYYLSLKRDKGYSDEYLAGCFIVGLRTTLREYFLPKELWEQYDR